MDNIQDNDLPRPARIPSTPPPVATKRASVSLRQQPRAVSARAPKSRPLGGILQIRAEEPELEQDQVQSQMNGQAQEEKEKEVAPISSPAGPATLLRQKDRSESIKAARPRPFGGKLKIDVDAAEMAAPPIIGSPLSYYSSKRLPSNTHEDHPVSMFTAAESSTGSGMLSTTSPFLEYGMIVSLVCDDRGGFVAAEGFASRDVRLEKLNYGTIQLRHMKTGKYVSLDPSPIPFRGSEYAPMPEGPAHISTYCRDLSFDLKEPLFNSQTNDESAQEDVQPRDNHPRYAPRPLPKTNRSFSASFPLLLQTKTDDDSGDQLRSRQNLFRTYQYIELLVGMIKSPFQCYGGPFSIEELCSFNDEYMNSRDTGDDNDELEMKGSPVRLRTDSSTAFRISGVSPTSRDLISPRRSISTQDHSWRRKSSVSVSASRLEIHIAAMQSLNRIIPAINVLLLHISWANRTNELYVVKVAMPVLMELLGNGFQTSLPLSYLLRENRNLVESITGCASITRNFFELIVTRGKSIRYMQFLVALCTSRGKGVPKTQEAICELLFNPANGYRDDVIIPIRPSRSGFDIYFCFSYLDCLQGAIVIDEIPENELTLAILRVSRTLAEFGMYSSEDELSRVVILLFDLLDERTDYAHQLPEMDNVHNPDIKNVKGYNSPTALLFPPALHLRQKSTASNAQLTQQRKMSMASARRPGWGTASQPSPHLKNAVLFDGAGAMSSIRVTRERDASKQYKVAERNVSRPSSGINSMAGANTESSPHRHLNKLLHKTGVHTTDGVKVYEMNEVNRVVMEIKDEICAILLLVDQLRVDFLISTLLASFQARHGGPPSSSPTRLRDLDAIHTALFDDAIVRETVSNAFTGHSRGLDILPHGHNHGDKMSPLAVYLFGSKSLECKLSLTRLGRRAVTTIFMQMLMYEYPPLVSKALELLLQQYNQHDQFLKEMQNVQLLVSEETISIYSKLKGDVDELRRLAETTEVWMDLTSRSDFEKAFSVCQLLQSLLRVIEHTKPDSRVADVEPRSGAPRRQLRIQSPGKPMSDDESSDDNANSAADLLSTNSKCTPTQVLLPEGLMREPVRDLTIEKQPPNRKLNYPTDRYALNPYIGHVSQFSCSHDLLPPFWKASSIGKGDGSITTKGAKDGRTIAMEARRLLRNLRAAQFVLSMLIDGAHFYEGHFSEDSDSQQHAPGSPTTRSKTKLQKRQRDKIRGVFGQAMQFLRAFCTDDAENQALVAPHATMIAEYVRELPIAQELLVAIYADNFPLYKSVPTELINTFVGRLIRDGPDPRYLFFLETLVLCDEQPIVENQLLVLFQLVKSFENAKVLQMFDDATQTVELLGGLLSRHTNLLERMAYTNKNIQLRGANTVNGLRVPGATQPDNVADSGKMLEYHVRLLNLFAACASGKNTRVQEICQQILPLLPEDVVSNIEEFIYVIDKSVRPIMIQYQAPLQTSLEQAWSVSLKYRERLDCASLNCELDLPDILLWALEKRDQETKSDTFTDESRPSSLPEASSSDTKDISPLGQAVREGNSNVNGPNSADARGRALASFKLDSLSTSKPVAWGDSGSKQPNQENREASPTYKADYTSEAVDVINRGRLLHRLSPRRYYKGLRDKRASPYLSPKKESPVTPFSFPAERRVSDAFIAPSSVYQSESTTYLTRQQQQFSELDQLLSWLQAHPRVHGAVRDELNQMVQGILGIETSMKEEFNPHVHVRNVMLSFDLVVAKLVEHVEALQDLSYLKTNLTLLNVFCRMIYAVEDAEERHNMQVKLNQLGVTRLVVQLISSRDNDALFASSIEVGVALLDGMNAEVQESFYSYWSEPANEQFFGRIQGRIEKACKLIHSVDRTSVGAFDGLDCAGNAGDKRAHRRQSIFGLNLDNLSGDKASAGDRGGVKRLGEPIASIFRFLQLLCEGHYLNAQRALIAQPNAAVSANLVESTTSFLLDTYLALTDLDMSLITQLFETITEYCQGPCVAAQETVANYKLISAVNALLTHTFEQRDTRAQDAVHKLRAAIVISLLSLLEGRSDQVIHSQLVQELNFEALKMNLVEVYVYFLRNHGVYAGNVKCSQDFYLTMGFNIYILLQQLADQNAHQAWWIPMSEELQSNQAWLPLQPTRSKVLSMCTGDGDSSPDFRDAFRFFQANCAKVEVVWDHHRSPAQYNVDRVVPRGAIQSASKADSGSVVNAPSADSDDISRSCTGALMPFYFPIHPICFCLTAKSKEKLVWDVSRGGDKLSDFYTRSDKLVDEMTHQSHLQLHLQVAWVARKSEEIKRASFALAVIINLVVLLFYRATGVYSTPFPASDVTFVHTWGQEVEPPKPSLWIDVALSLAGSVQIILYSMVLICYMLNSAPLLIKKGWKRRHRKEQTKHAKRSVHNAHHSATKGKERESFQDTEQLLRSLREREEEYNYLLLPPSIRKRSAPKKRKPASPRVKASASGMGSSKPACVSDAKSGGASARGDFRVQLEITTISLYFLVRSPRVIYSLLQIFVSVLGAYVNKLYFAFLLLDVVDRYKELNNVLRSISRPAKALGVTTLLYLIVVYVFAVVGFFFFREDYTLEEDISDAQIEGRAPYTCQRLFQCFLVSLDQGLKSDGGLGSYLRQIPLGTSAHSYGRLAFDVLYNILLVVLLLNLIFGVIIDTFASLRTNDQEKILDMQGRCFICSIDAYTFDRATKRGFHDHISRDHNMWHYLYLFVHIRKKNITEYNGLELFLAMRMAKKDMSFFPTHRALSLTKRGDLEESHDLDSATDDDRFYAASTTYGPKRYPVTPFSPSRGPSFLSGAPSSSRRGSDRSRARARSKRNSSVTTASRSVAYFDSVPGVQAFDRATAGNLERIEATINELANAQIEIKEAQRRAENRHAEFLAAMQPHAPLSQFPTPQTSISGVSIGGSPPALSRRPSNIVGQLRRHRIPHAQRR
ncbi:ryanodine-inositol 1,4,5-triphosphate receptor Ca2 channel (RIR-CaC) family protein [Phytophthora infestans T30-4]|uniref:Ryanodine-inositol 1,4,5-triphosphate receptor Ca2 channel (RIR-CaC) family protein n=1 Tax=Phytophthora infestans (strain T30-4) TaxID=403677 RepID=D0MSD5_PHYIT|nr:ryanodine-inositol 1,4,5-triphosphate receptor Ca2 channel (RIR-CaC) family protein [Phytophthora infestans T30-4]EEY58404.1 ryanodine-inositol 1,4,5-triphosphate receptor Ca2 channel (RIR-CaC) family protein [Phytophthora infestans T30-4]|eukprot:XP_002909590.1 ryanodine-inositol 1,4,5-triphosphate receptor Ca2 channel (RIR-CaC) family protein [Phytophthora infestans T30-4]